MPLSLLTEDLTKSLFNTKGTSCVILVLRYGRCLLGKFVHIVLPLFQIFTVLSLQTCEKLRNALTNYFTSMVISFIYEKNVFLLSGDITEACIFFLQIHTDFSSYLQCVSVVVL